MDSGELAASVPYPLSETERACFREARARIRALDRRDPRSVACAILTGRGQIVVALNTDHEQDWKGLCAESGALADALHADPRAEPVFSVAVDCNELVVTPCDDCIDLLAEYAPELRVAVPDPGPTGTGLRVSTLPALMAARAERRHIQPLGVILAGGRATRMGGGDKMLNTLGGRRLIDHVTNRLRPQVGALVINANGDPARLSALSLPVIADTMPDRPGPLAGVLAGLDYAAAHGVDFILSVAGDTPFLPTDLVARLQTAAGPTGLAIAASPDARGQIRQHPTVGLWPVVLREALRTALTEGRHKMTDWTTAHGAGLALFEPGPPDPFFNINTPDDLARAEALLRHA